MASQWLKARQTKYAAYAATYILVVIAVVVVANVLADRYNKSYDCHIEQALQPSEQTAKIVKGLKQRRNHHLLRPEHAASATAKICWTNTRAFRPRCTSNTSIPTRSRSWRARRAFKTYGTALCKSATRKKKPRA